MKKTILAVIVCLSASALLLANGTNVLRNEKERVSYAIGMMFGQQWQERGIEVDPDYVARGLKDVQSGGPMLLTPQEMHDTLVAYQRTLAARQRAMQEELAAKNQAEGEAFLAANKTKPGVVTLPDGLQYKVLTNGDGAVPTAADTVEVNYRGTLIGGKEFDSSAKHGHPLRFQVGRVIRGWSEALTMMKAGSDWELFIPPDLAYGVNGRPGIPPNSVLIFNVQLLSVEPAPPQPSFLPGAPHHPLTSDIIRVPSAQEMKHGAKIEVIKPQDIKKYQSQTNAD